MRAEFQSSARIAFFIITVPPIYYSERKESCWTDK